MKEIDFCLGAGCDRATAKVRSASVGLVGEVGLCEELGPEMHRWTFPGWKGVIWEAPESEETDEFVWEAQHVRVIEISMMDQTDLHNELYREREWLVWTREMAFQLTCPAVAVENSLTGEGRVFLRLAPLPHARMGRQVGAEAMPSGVEGEASGAVEEKGGECAQGHGVRPDYEVIPAEKKVRIFRTGYPVAEVVYEGGRAGRIRALHSVQRKIRQYMAGRDGQFVSNTWGDRSRDARIQEAFLLQEIEAGAKLGVDVVEIDDGWEKGKTLNAASVIAGNGTGAWDGYWAFDPEFWEPNRERFPRGLEPVVAAAKAKGMRLGLWFGPDSSREAANWERDAELLLKLYHELGVEFIKVDSMKTHSALALKRQRMLFNRVQEGSDGRVVIDLDVTAELRPGYFGLPDVGTLFVENRYTDWHNYWPHQTLRNLWTLSQAVDPVRLRMEVLNPLRNQEQYVGDPLAPSCYRADTLFAMTMMGSPLGWFEMSNLAPETLAEMAALVAVWKRERERMHRGATVPVGAQPDGVAWTGFVTQDAEGPGGYVLLFRELNAAESFELDWAEWFPQASGCRVLAGRGAAERAGAALRVSIPATLDYVWVRVE